MRPDVTSILFASLLTGGLWIMPGPAAGQTDAAESAAPPLPTGRPAAEPGETMPAEGNAPAEEAAPPLEPDGSPGLDAIGESQPGAGAAASAADPAPRTPDIADVPIPDTRPASPPPQQGLAVGSEVSETDDPGVNAPAAEADTRTTTAAAAPDVPPDNGLQPATPTSEELRAATLDVTPAEAVRAAAAIADAKACEAELTSRGVKFSISESISEGDCGVLRPVAVEALSSGVAVSPETRMLCRTALALDEWVSKGVAASAAANLDGAELSALRTASTYVCRPRVGGTRISEHARGSAVDIVTFIFEGGREIAVERQAAGSPEAMFQREARRAACGPFKTVLGPGSNADHATHFHFDLAARRKGATYCR